MAIADLAWSLNFLNVSYGDDDLDSSAAIRDQPLLQMIDIEQYGGSTVEEKFELAPQRGFSGNLTDAQAVALAGGPQDFRWQHPFGRRVGSIQVDVEDVMQSSPDRAAAAKALEHQVEGGLEGEAQQMNDLLFGRAGLSRGFGEYEETASGSYPAFAVRFADPAEAKNFHIGDQVVVSTGDGTSAGSLVGEPGYVVGRDVAVGYIQVAALDDPDTAANPGSWVDDTNYYVYNLGMFSEAGTPDTFVTSYERFLPDSAATDTLHNVDRSFDSSLSGARLPAAQEVGSIIQRAKRLITIMHSRLGLKKKDAGNIIVALNSEDWGTAAEELESKVQRDVGETTEEGYEAFFCRTAVGKTAFVSEPGKRKGRGFILNTSLLKIYTADGKLFTTIPDGSGNIVHLMPGRNTYEIRTLSKPATGFGAPFMHGSFDTTTS